MGGLLATLTDLLNGGPIVRRHRQRTEQRGWDSVAEILEMARGPRLYSGVQVDDEQAMRLSAVWQCVDLLSELVSTLPVDEYRRVEGGPPRLLPSSPLLTDPAGDGTGFEFWCRQLMTSLLLRGNGYGLILGLGSDGWPTQIEMLHPDRVSLRRTKTFGPPDEWLLDDNPIGKWPVGPLWHLAGYPIPGSPIGVSPIRYARETIGVGLAAQKFGAQWFGDGAHPTAMLHHDTEPVASEAEAKALKQRIMAAMHDNREPLILGGGWKLDPIQVNPEESQFLETVQANAEDVARFFFRRPPGSGLNITYENVEARSLDLLTYTVNGWLVRVERALSRLRPAPRFVKFNADALLRVDLKTRYEAHVLGVRGGVFTPNERRELEDYPPLPDGDKLLWPPYATSESPPEGENDDRSSQPA